MLRKVAFLRYSLEGSKATKDSPLKVTVSFAPVDPEEQRRRLRRLAALLLAPSKHDSNSPIANASDRDKFTSGADDEH